LSLSSKLTLWLLCGCGLVIQQGSIDGVSHLRKRAQGLARGQQVHLSTSHLGLVHLMSRSQQTFSRGSKHEKKWLSWMLDTMPQGIFSEEILLEKLVSY
jgi:hypothetical protein